MSNTGKPEIDQAFSAMVTDETYQRESEKVRESMDRLSTSGQESQPQAHILNSFHHGAEKSGSLPTNLNIPAGESMEEQFSVDSIAKVCHEANRTYCLTLGDKSQQSMG